ncbi:MAG: hypothetical protein KBC22_00490 [Candidatus Pacebacteria bacterium]|nr:hypothetical protein [Candidatus Paceibacterota bacterium]
MENFDHKQYRAGLARDLAELPKEDREHWLASERETKEYQQADELHSADRVITQQQARERRIAELDQQIEEKQIELQSLQGQRDSLVAIDGGPKVIKMYTEYIANLERPELWNEFTVIAEDVLQDYLKKINNLSSTDVMLSYDAGQVAVNMFEVMRPIFNIPKEVSFKELPEDIRQKFIQTRRVLEDKNHVQKKEFTVAKSGF